MHCLLNRNQSRKSENVFSTLQSHKTDKIHLLARLGPFTDANDRFLYHFLYFNKWNPYTLIYLKLLRIGHQGECPPPPEFLGLSPQDGPFFEQSKLLITRFVLFLKWEQYSLKTILHFIVLLYFYDSKAATLL